MTKSQTRELDKLLREACFARDGHKCLKCGRTDQLAPSHIYPKGTYKKMRHDLDNVKTLCFQHHIHWWHKNPIEAWEWLQATLPKERLARLKLMAQTTFKGKEDVAAIRLYLRAMIKKYQDNG